MERPPSPFKIGESELRDEIASRIQEASDPATPTSRLKELLVDALEQRKRSRKTSRHMAMRWGEVVRQAAMNPSAGIDVIAMGAGAGYADAVRNPLLPLYFLDEPSGSGLYDALVKHRGLGIFVRSRDVMPEALSAFWAQMLADEKRIPLALASALANIRMPEICVEDAERRVGAASRGGVDRFISLCLEGLVLRPDRPLGRRREWMRRIVGEDARRGESCASFAAFFGERRYASFADPELFDLLCEGFVRGLQGGDGGSWQNGREDFELALESYRSGEVSGEVLSHLPSERQLVEGLRRLDEAKEIQRTAVVGRLRRVFEHPWCREHWGQFHAEPHERVGIRVWNEAVPGKDMPTDRVSEKVVSIENWERFCEEVERKQKDRWIFSLR
jgi:hypothetical protein